MARAWAPLSAASAGALPPLCARSGGATSRFRAVQAKARAGWTWWLLPLGVVPFLVVRHFALEVTVLVPLSERIERRLDRLRVGGVIALLQAVLLIALGTLDAHRAALLLGVAFLLVALLFRATGAALSVRVQVDPSARAVLLTGVHPAFRDAVDHRHQEGWGSAEEAIGYTRE
jgi:hypothetical protein